MATNLSFRKCDLSDLDELREIAYTTFNDTFAQHNKPHNIESYLAKAFNIDQVRTEFAGLKAYAAQGTTNQKRIEQLNSKHFGSLQVTPVASSSAALSLT